MVVQGIRARHFWGFPLFRPLDGKRLLSSASTVVENQTFGAGVTKKILPYFITRTHLHSDSALPTLLVNFNQFLMRTNFIRFWTQNP